MRGAVRFTKVAISENPFQDCTVQEPRSDIYAALLDRHLMNPQRRSL